MNKIKALGALLVLCLWTTAALAGPYSVVRMVNNTPITQYELDQRMKLLRVLGARDSDLRGLAMERLTEDRLKLQAATALGMSLQEDALEESVNEFAAQRQTTAAGLYSQISQGGVERETLHSFVRDGILWRDLVNIRFRSRATPSEADLETILNYAASARQESVFIREIAIPFAERGTEGARRLAEQIIVDVRNGANFSELARAFSRSPSAQKGGAVGWTPLNRMPPLFASQLLALSPGELTNPIEVPVGIIVLQLADIREEAVTGGGGTTVSYFRLDVPIPEGSSPEAAQARAVSLAGELDSCADAEARVLDFGPASGRFGPQSAGDVPGDVGLVLANLDAGETGILAPGSAGVSVITLCNRSATNDPEAIENLQNQVFNQRMNNYASSYIQELLADAIIVDK